MIRRKKKTAKQLLAIKCINLWKKKFIRSKCELCGSVWKLTGHHFYYKGSYKFLSYEKDNCVSLCGRCHFSLHFGGDPKKVEEKIIAVRGKKWFNRIKKKSLQCPFGSYLTEQWYEEQLSKIKKQK